MTVRYIEVFNSNEESHEEKLDDSANMPFYNSRNDAVSCFNDGSEIAWFSPYLLHTSTLITPYVETLRRTDQTCESACQSSKEELDLISLEHFYLKDFRDGCCIEIPLSSLNF